MPDGLPDVPEAILDGIGDAVEGIAPQTPDTPTTPVETPAPSTPEGQAQDGAATDAPDSFTKLDPNTLPEEVRPYYDSMLSDYTRKTQEASPWRKLGEETGVQTPEELRQAAELYAHLQNPDNLQKFYSQLGDALGQGNPVTPTVPEPTQGPEFGTELDDPAVSQLRQEIASIKEQVAQRDQAAQQEQLQWALLGEMNRQEAMLKEQHPAWEPEGEEWTAVWNMAPAFDGDLTKAASMIEATQNAAITRLLNGKSQAAATEGLSAPAPPRAAVTVPSVDGSDPELRQETQQALEFLRGVVNQSE